MSCTKRKGLFDKTLFDQQIFGLAVIIAVFALFNPSQYQTHPFDTEQVCEETTTTVIGGGFGKTHDKKLRERLAREHDEWLEAMRIVRIQHDEEEILTVLSAFLQIV